MEQSQKEQLARKIWITRKCRINASERLLSDAKYFELLNVYFSIVAIIISLISLVTESSRLSLASLIVSIFLTITIMYANSAGLRDRSSLLKQNYIELQSLLDQLSFANDDDKECIKGIGSKYLELLKSSENHTPIDLYQLKKSSTDPDLKLSKDEKRDYYCRSIWRIVWKGILAALPIVIIFIWH